MSATLNISAPESVVVHFEPSKLQMNDQEFYEFCKLNPELRIERTSEGDIVVMAPTGGKTGKRNFRLIGAMAPWVEADGTGLGFDSSTVFSLPNRAKRSPDVSWVRNERWEKLSTTEQEQFPPLCPDFVIELRSQTDSLKALKMKMEEYTANGAQLGWLIDPLERKVHIYRPAAEPEVMDNPEKVSGEPLLKGFVLDVRSIWD
ncbi:MAG TPA: Uma2 family endonuclease [Pyrinomonadaceae bacterium]|nr:Uma2 family endonuclease [Pyrinomonadaceae bacterium]